MSHSVLRLSLSRSLPPDFMRKNCPSSYISRLLSISTTRGSFDMLPNPKKDVKVIHEMLDKSLYNKKNGLKALNAIKHRLSQYSQLQIIELMKRETAPNYEGSFPLVICKTEGPFWVDSDGYYHLNANTSYGAKRFTELTEYNKGDLPSRAVYTPSQLLATLVVNTYGRAVGIQNTKSLVLMSGSDVMRAAFDGCERIFNLNIEHIIFENHFHGRSAFNEWNYTSNYFKQTHTTALEFNNAELLKKKVDSLISNDSKKGVAIYIEPVQGEGGVTAISRDFEQSLIQLKKNYPKNVIIIVDNVQRGFAGEDLFGVNNLIPDAMALSKSVNNGDYPVGVLVGKDEFMNQAFAPGTHGGTGSLRDDGCESIINAFEMFTNTNAIPKLQEDTDTILHQLTQLSTKNADFTIKSDGSSMIGICCKTNELAKEYQKKALLFQELFHHNESNRLRQALIAKHTTQFDDKERNKIELFFKSFKSMPIKIAGDNKTLRFSGQMLSPKNMAVVKIVLEFIFSKHEHHIEK